MYVGGIVGQIAGGHIIDSCYNISDVSGNINVGGILGYTYKLDSKASDIKNCYSIGEIAGTIYVGDIEGIIEKEEIKDNIINCYTKDQTFTAKDLGDAFTDDENYEYPILNWEQNSKNIF